MHRLFSSVLTQYLEDNISFFDERYGQQEKLVHHLRFCDYSIPLTRMNRSEMEKVCFADRRGIIFASSGRNCERDAWPWNQSVRAKGGGNPIH